MPEIVDRLLTNNAYGFPSRGARRRVTPVALACLHITANSSTAKNTDLHAAADDERDYANRDGSQGPSAHFYVARDGWAIRAIPPVGYAAWSNGDVKSPNRDNPGIVKVLNLVARGYNANEGYWLEIENVGNTATGYPITVEQKQACAALIAGHAKRTGLPINRATVHGHWEINGIDRDGCPSPKHEAFLGDVIARAKAILNPPDPEPDPPIEPADTTPFTQVDLDASYDLGFAAGFAEAKAQAVAAVTAIRPLDEQEPVA